MTYLSLMSETTLTKIKLIQETDTSDLGTVHKLAGIQNKVQVGMCVQDSNQSAYPHSLISVFVFHLKTRWTHG